MSIVPTPNLFSVLRGMEDVIQDEFAGDGFVMTQSAYLEPTLARGKTLGIVDCSGLLLAFKERGHRSYKRLACRHGRQPRRLPLR